jgi:hypothetical protein
MPKREKKLVTRSIPAFIARTQFGQILERVSKEKERILVTKNGHWRRRARADLRALELGAL